MGQSQSYSSVELRDLLGAKSEDAVSKARPIGPRLIVVLDKLEISAEEERKMLESIKQQPLINGVYVHRHEFAEGSPLADKVVVSVQAPIEILKLAAERRGIYKMLVLKETGEAFKDNKFREAAKELHLWRPFRMNRSGEFMESENDEKFFTHAEILFLICDILCSQQPNTSGKLPILLKRAAEGKLQVFAPRDEGVLDEICREWHSSFKIESWHQRVPTQKITSYFGPGVSLYFVFLQSYTRWLICPAFCGAVLWLVRKILFKHNKVHYVLQACYTLMIAIWSHVFICNWRHLVAISAYETGHHEHFGKFSPMFNAAKFLEESVKVSHGDEESVNRCRLDSSALTDTDFLSSLRRRMVSTPLLGKRGLLHYIIVLFAMVFLLTFSVILISSLINFGEAVADKWENLFIQKAPAIVYIVVVNLFKAVYDRLALWLTRFEKHVVYRRYLRSMTVKTIAFQLINFLGWFLYVAFWKKDMDNLESGLFMFFTVKQFLGNITEIVVPYLKELHRQLNVRGNSEGERNCSRLSQLCTVCCALLSGAQVGGRKLSEDMSEEEKLNEEIELEYSRPANDISDDYLELAVLFAAFTWFAPVFPEGAVLALLHAVVEAWVDRRKLCKTCRRIVPQGTSMLQIEAWLDIFEVINAIGIALSFACLFYSGRRWGIYEMIAVEHVILFCWFYLNMSIPKEPEWLDKYNEMVETVYPLQDWLSQKPTCQQETSKNK